MNDIQDKLLALAKEAIMMGVPVTWTPEAGIIIGVPPKPGRKSNAESCRKWRAKKKLLGGDTRKTGLQWREIRRAVFERDGHRFAYCGSDGGGKALHCDHIVPVCKGGSNDMNNLATACHMCNASKGGRLVTEWKPMHFKQFYRFSMENYKTVEQHLYAQ